MRTGIEPGAHRRFTLPAFAAAALILVTSGCTHDVNVDELPGLKVHVDLRGDPRDWADDLVYFLQLELMHDDVLAVSCPLIGPDTTAEVDGVPVPMRDNGGGLRGGAYPFFELAEDAFPPASATSTIRIKDEGAPVEIEIANLFARREVTLTSPLDPVLRAGDVAELAVLPVTDTISWSDVVICADDGQSACDEFEETRVEGVIEGNRITFTVPDLALPQAHVCLEHVSPEILRCEGPEVCTTSVYIFRDEDALCVDASIER